MDHSSAVYISIRNITNYLTIGCLYQYGISKSVGEHYDDVLKEVKEMNVINPFTVLGTGVGLAGGVIQMLDTFMGFSTLDGNDRHVECYKLISLQTIITWAICHSLDRWRMNRNKPDKPNNVLNLS